MSKQTSSLLRAAENLAEAVGWKLEKGDGKGRRVVVEPEYPSSIEYDGERLMLHLLVHCIVDKKWTPEQIRKASGWTPRYVYNKQEGWYVPALDSYYFPFFQLASRVWTPRDEP